MQIYKVLSLVYTCQPLSSTHRIDQRYTQKQGYYVNSYTVFSDILCMKLKLLIRSFQWYYAIYIMLANLF